MPSYEYICVIHGEFDEFHSILDEAKLTECPFCRKENNILTPVKRLISGGSGRGIVELTGNDYVNKIAQDAQQYKREVYSSEKHYSNILGTDKYESLQKRIDKNRR